ncbi:MAG: hypothetical protein WD036_03820 [Bauldia sp.]
MAEYFAVLTKAVASLETSTVEARRAVYDKARNALIGQLKAIDPPLPPADISRQRLELEEAIRRVERAAVSNPAAIAGRPAGQPAAPPGSHPARSPQPIPPAAPVAEVPATPADGRPSPQDVFRRAMHDAGARGESPPAERAPATARQTPNPESAKDTFGNERIERPPPPRSTRGYSERSPAAPEPRLAPDYDWEREEPAAGPQYEFEPDVDHEAERSVRRGRRGPVPNDEALAARPSRLPAILLLILIIAMVGGLAAFGWSQRDILADLLSWSDSQTAEAPPPADAASTEPAEGPAPVSNKDPGRLLPGEASDQPVRVVEPSPAATDAGTGAPAVTAPEAGTQLDVDAVVAQKAVLYEEPPDSARASSGADAFDAAVTWSYVADGPNGPQITANVDVPGRGMKVTISIRRNTDATLPASHLIEVVADTPADFPGEAIRNIPRFILKPSEDARGQPLLGAAATVAEGFFWIALSGVEADVKANLELLKTRGWIDVPMVYGTGQRAILTIEKGTPGERVFERALAAWEE